MITTHIVVGTNDDFDHLSEEVTINNSVNWIVPKNAQRGDKVLFLIPSFEGDIVASGIVAGIPSKSEKWARKYTAKIKDIVIIDPFISMEVLRILFPEWKYLKYARSYTTVPSEYVNLLLTLLDTDKRFDIEIGTSPDEILTKKYSEGAVRQVIVNAYERNPNARKKCIEYYGTNCQICGFHFGQTYGRLAEGLIHVHHLRLLSEIGEEYEVDPVKDLLPVCANCHAVIHRKTPPYSIEEIKQALATQV